jgi:hypothetical protein
MILIVNFFFVQSTNQMELLWASLQQTPNPAPVQQIPTVFLIIEAVFSYIQFYFTTTITR